jgi:hypothetical protein
MGSVAPEEIPSESFGYDFEDNQTRKELELIDDLQKLDVSKQLDLPQVSSCSINFGTKDTFIVSQLVVVGDQSTGKSSVLQAVTEIPFSIDGEMCTRFATEIVLRRTPPNEPAKVDICIIPDKEETSERKKILETWQPDRPDPVHLDKITMQSIFQQVC